MSDSILPAVIAFFIGIVVGFVTGVTGAEKNIVEGCNLAHAFTAQRVAFD